MKFRSRLTVQLSIATAAAWLIGCSANALAVTSSDTTNFSVTAGSLTFSTAPASPTFGAITLNGAAQTTNATMTNFAVDDATGSGSGWNVTVQGDSGTSAVFKQYCPSGTCGADSGPGFKTGGYTLPANSLTLDSTSASLTGASGSAPTLQCGSLCNVDSAAPVKIVSAATSAGMGTWTTTGWTGTSLALATPSNLHVLQSGELYRVNLVWTLTSGP